jgi:hypothetical protein
MPDLCKKIKSEIQILLGLPGVNLVVGHIYLLFNMYWLPVYVSLLTGSCSRKVVKELKKLQPTQIEDKNATEPQLSYPLSIIQEPPIQDNQSFYTFLIILLLIFSLCLLNSTTFFKIFKK